MADSKKGVLRPQMLNVPDGFKRSASYEGQINWLAAASKQATQTSGEAFEAAKNAMQAASDAKGFALDALAKVDANVPYVTPEMFGAVGDGVADDTEAVQRAIDSTFFVIMAKNYYISTPLTMTSNKKALITGVINSSTDGFVITGQYNWLYICGDVTTERDGIILTGSNASLRNAYNNVVVSGKLFVKRHGLSLISNVSGVSGNTIKIIDCFGPNPSNLGTGYGGDISSCGVYIHINSTGNCYVNQNKIYDGVFRRFSAGIMIENQRSSFPGSCNVNIYDNIDVEECGYGIYITGSVWGSSFDVRGREYLANLLTLDGIGYDNFFDFHGQQKISALTISGNTTSPNEYNANYFKTPILRDDFTPLGTACYTVNDIPYWYGVSSGIINSNNSDIVVNTTPRIIRLDGNTDVINIVVPPFFSRTFQNGIVIINSSFGFNIVNTQGSIILNGKSPDLLNKTLLLTPVTDTWINVTSVK